MLESALYAIKPVTGLMAFIVLAYSFFFGPFRRFIGARVIQRYALKSNRDLIFHEIGFTFLNLTIVITLTMFIMRWLFGNAYIETIPSPSLSTSISQFLIYFFTFDLFISVS